MPHFYIKILYTFLLQYTYIVSMTLIKTISSFLYLLLITLTLNCTTINRLLDSLSAIDNAVNNITLQVSVNNINFNGAESKETFSIISKNTWQIEVPKEAHWLKLSQKTNSSLNSTTFITVSAQENQNEQAREAILSIVTSGGATKKVVVRQDTYLPTITIESAQNVLNLAHPLATNTILFSSTRDWSANVVDANWIVLDENTLSGKGGNALSLTFTVQENQDSYVRSGQIAITSLGVTQTITINQSSKDLVIDGGPILTTDKSILSFTSNSTLSGIFKIIANTDWVIEETQNTSWVSLSTKSFTQDSDVSSTITTTSVVVSVQPNNDLSNRQATFTLRNINKSIILNVVQQAEGVLTINLNGSNVFGALSSDTRRINLTANNLVNVSITEGSEWLKIVGYARTSPNIAYVDIKVLNNLSNSRKANIRFQSGSITKNLEITQMPLRFSTTISDVTVADNATSYTLVVDTEVPCTLQKTGDWFTIPSTSLSASPNTQSLILTPTRNTSLSSRTGVLVFQAVGLNKTFEVKLTQQARNTQFAVYPDSLQFGYGRNNMVLALSSNENWQATLSPNSSSWLTINKSSGNSTTNESLTITALYNVSSTTRTANITFTKNGQTLVVPIQQAGSTPLLEIVGSSNIAFNNQTLTQNISLKSNRDWTASVTTGSEWLSINNTSGTALVDEAGALQNITLNIRVTKNTTLSSRTGQVTISNGSVTKTLSVQQAVVNFSIGNISNITFDGVAANRTFTVTSEFDWTVSVDNSVDWLSVTPVSSGANLQGVNHVISVLANNTAQARTTTITVQSSGISKTIFVRQNVESLTLNSESLTFTSSAEQKELQFSANQNWTASITSGNDWLSLNNTSGASGQSTITVSAQANTGLQRSGVVRLTVGTLIKDISISQVAFKCGTDATTNCILPLNGVFTAVAKSEARWHKLIIPEADHGVEFRYNSGVGASNLKMIVRDSSQTQLLNLYLNSGQSVNRLFTPGTYYVIVEQYVYASPNQALLLNTDTLYTLTIQSKIDACRDTVGTLCTLPLNSHVASSIEYSGDSDFWKIIITEQGILTLYTKQYDTNTSSYSDIFDSYGILYSYSNNTLTEVANNDDIDINQGKYWFQIRQNVQPGTYYIAVKDLYLWDSNNYTLYADFTANP